MKLIREKKIHPYVMTALVYVSFCFNSWFTSRGSLALLSYQYNVLAQTPVLFNDIFAFLFGGIVPTLLYELITVFTFKFAQVRMGGATDEMRYALRFFYIPANLVCFALKLLYLISPLVSVYGEVIIDFAVTAAFVVWFLAYSAKHFVAKEKWGPMLYQIGGTFLIVYSVITVLGLIMEVL